MLPQPQGGGGLIASVSCASPDPVMLGRRTAPSWRNHQLLDIEQQKVGTVTRFPVAVIADDDDLLAAVDHGGTHSFGVLES